MKSSCAQVVMQSAFNLRCSLSHCQIAPPAHACSFSSMLAVGAELCCPKIHIPSPDPQFLRMNVTIFGDKAFREEIKLK